MLYLHDRSGSAPPSRSSRAISGRLNSAVMNKGVLQTAWRGHSGKYILLRSFTSQPASISFRTTGRYVPAFDSSLPARRTSSIRCGLPCCFLVVAPASRSNVTYSRRSEVALVKAIYQKQYEQHDLWDKTSSERSRLRYTENFPTWKDHPPPPNKSPPKQIGPNNNGASMPWTFQSFVYILSEADSGAVLPPPPTDDKVIFHTQYTYQL